MPSSSFNFNPSLTTLYGGTRTTTFFTTFTVTPGQQSVTVGFPNPPVTADLAYTTVDIEATQTIDSKSSIYPTGLPILALTDVVGIIVNTEGLAIATDTLIQPLPPQATSATPTPLAPSSGSRRLIFITLPTLIGTLLVLAFLFLFWRSRSSRKRRSKFKPDEEDPEKYSKSGPQDPKAPKTEKYPMAHILSNVEQGFADDEHRTRSSGPPPPKRTRSRDFALPAAIAVGAVATENVRKDRSGQHRNPEEGLFREQSIKAKGLEEDDLPERRQWRQDRNSDNGRDNDRQPIERMGGQTWIRRNERGSIEREPGRRRAKREYGIQDERDRDQEDDGVKDRRRSRPRSVSPPRRRSKSKSKRRNSDSHSHDWTKWLAILPLALEAVHLLSEPKGGWDTYLKDEHKKELEDKSKLKKHAKQYGDKLLESHIRRHRHHRRKERRPSPPRSRSSDYAYKSPHQRAPGHRSPGPSDRKISDAKQGPEIRGRVYDSDDQPGPSSRTRHSRRSARMRDSGRTSYEARHSDEEDISDESKATSMPERDGRREGRYEQDDRGRSAYVKKRSFSPPPHSYIRTSPAKR